MKSILGTLSLVAVLLIVGCTKSHETISSQPIKPSLENNKLVYSNQTEFLSVINSVGQAHNGAMDQFYTNIVGYISNGWVAETRAEFDGVMTVDIINYMTSQGFNYSGFVPFDYHPATMTNVTPAAQLIINSMNDLIEDYANDDINQATFITGCNNLKIQAYNNLIGDQTSQIAAGLYIAVGQYSTIYWYTPANWNKYQALGGTTGTGNKMSENQKAVAYADAVGAWNGARVGAGGGLAGAIVGGSFGAACNSVATAICVTKLKGQFGWIQDWI